MDNDILPFGTPFHEIRDGFGRIDRDELTGSVQALARHEQLNILQRILYDDAVIQRLLALNQYAVVTVLRAAEQFNSLLNSSARPRIEASLRAIAAGGGVA